MRLRHIKTAIIMLMLFSILMTLVSCNSGTDSNIKIQSPYWVENGIKLVTEDEVVFEDDDGIYIPLLSHDGKYIAYSNGGNELLVYNVSKGKCKAVYKADSADYRVYAAGWSADDKYISLITSQSGGFLGGNELIIVDAESGDSEIVMKKLSGADWGCNGKFVVADSSEINIINEEGRSEKKLTTPPVQAAFSPDNPVFSPDCKYVVYNCGSSYYLHDIEKDEYKKIFEVSSADGSARMNSDGKIIVSKAGDLYIYNINDNSFNVFYDKADSSYPNW